MKSVLLFDGIGASGTNTVACAQETPFTVGSSVVIAVTPDSACDFTVQFLTDDAETGTYAEIIAATDFTDLMTRFYTIDCPHNLRAVVASRTAGTVDVTMFGNV